jgi:hypothetical protein
MASSSIFVGGVANSYHQPASKELRKEIRLELPVFVIKTVCESIGDFRSFLPISSKRAHS